MIVIPTFSLSIILCQWDGNPSFYFLEVCRINAVSMLVQLARVVIWKMLNQKKRAISIFPGNLTSF